MGRGYEGPAGNEGLGVRAVKSSKQEPSTRHVAIERALWDVPVRIRLRAYVEFVERLDADIEKLLARWGPAAPPRTRFRPPRKPR